MTLDDTEHYLPGTPVILLVDPDMEYVKNCENPTSESCPFKKGGLYFLREKCHVSRGSILNSILVLTEPEGIGDNPAHSVHPFYVEYRQNVYFPQN